MSADKDINPRTPKDMLRGVIHRTNNYGNLRVFSFINRHRVIVDFIDTEFRTSASVQNVRLGVVKDKMMPSVYGVGFVGEGRFKASINKKVTKSLEIWRGMLARCYSDIYQSKYPTYKGCSVCKEWHNFQNFAAWFELNYSPGLELDKDIRIDGNKIYSPNTCLFVTRTENLIKSHAKNYRFTNPKGVIKEIYNLYKFCKENGLDNACMSKVHLGQRKSHKGWVAASE